MIIYRMTVPASLVLDIPAVTEAEARERLKEAIGFNADHALGFSIDLTPPASWKTSLVDLDGRIYIDDDRALAKAEVEDTWETEQ